MFLLHISLRKQNISTRHGIHRYIKPAFSRQIQTQIMISSRNTAEQNISHGMTNIETRQTISTLNYNGKNVILAKEHQVSFDSDLQQNQRSGSLKHLSQTTTDRVEIH